MMFLSMFNEERQKGHHGVRMERLKGHHGGRAGIRTAKRHKWKLQNIRKRLPPDLPKPGPDKEVRVRVTEAPVVKKRRTGQGRFQV